MDIAFFTKLRISAAMEQSHSTDNNHRISSMLQALTKASKDLQSYPIFTSAFDPLNTVESLLDLQTEADAIFATDTNLFKLSQLFSTLRLLLRDLRESQGYSFGRLLRRQITYFKIHRLAFAIEAEIQTYADRECVHNLVKTLQRLDSEEEKLRVLKGFEDRLSKGFDGRFQQLVLNAKVFAVVESLLCDSTCSKKVREQSALVIVGLVRFNRDVFVGLVLMGTIIQALISMASYCSIKVLCALIILIRTPLIDEIELDGEIPRIVSLLGSEDVSIQVAAMDCVCQIAYFGRKEVMETMLGQGLIEKLVKLQRSIACEEEEEEEECEIGAENGEFASCVARFAVMVEVGEGLRLKEQQELKREMLRRVREACVSEVEAASIVAEVLWGSS